MSSEDKNAGEAQRLHPFDHRELNKKFNYYHFDEKVGPGLPLWLPPGVILRDELEKLMRELEFQGGYQRVVSPHIAREELYYQSGHLPYYEDGMFPAMELENAKYRLRPMCCPHHHKMFSSSPRSYRELPLRLAEYGQVYRHELSGVMSGLMRVRGLCQNDAHIYCREDQVRAEIIDVLKMYQEAYKILGIVDFSLRLSKWDPADASRSQKYVPFPEKWAWSENLLREILQELKLPFVEAPGEAAFYGPKIDVQLKNIYGREETVSTVQLDFASSGNFELSYIDNEGQKKEPLILHRAPLGSHERLVAFVIEHYRGNFPLWLAPEQVRILPIADRHHEWAGEVAKFLRKNFIRVDVDERIESLSKKMAEVQDFHVPYSLVIGDNEVASKSVSLRRRGERQPENLSLEAVRNELCDRIDCRD